MEDVAKFYKIDCKQMQQCVKRYFLKSNSAFVRHRDKQQLKKLHEDEVGMQLQMYLDSRVGQYTTVKMMTHHLKSTFRQNRELMLRKGLSVKFINCANVTKVLKSKLGYRWKANCHRAPNAFNPKYVNQRKMFPFMISELTKRGFIIIYVDECSISPQAISNKSWQKKGEPQPLIRPGD